MDTNQKRTQQPKTPSYKYSFRLNEEQNIRFNELLCKAGLEHNRSRFIVKRIFAEEFVVVRRDPSKVQFVVRLNDFYFQFQKLGNNYNQIVKAVNAHFSDITIPHQIAAWEQRREQQSHTANPISGIVDTILDMADTQAYEEQQRSIIQQKRKRKPRSKG